MDNIDKLLQEIKQDRNITGRRPPKGFNNTFLNKVGEIFETHGFGTTQVYLQGQEQRDREEARALLCLLDKFRRCPEIKRSPAIGRYIIKTLDTIIVGGGQPC
jgi:hypothetical protein